ncbi:MAG: DNA-directed RNA polymerase, sigma subunit (sigma70/sigma32) [uncultured bacterium]|uniref:RNA polymerase sigma factor n=1 Tax=Candidatus Wolfebacteria bacterium GW2011_GWE2_44_13 TaxID=1619017 RepID=A0A0G1K551_9BACT|nr:MAG: DNA-directed RNA polymerase, sigma subunit (sigma70/sigma32) [uncultured bacterium]KKT42979.1 MAG: RNA polymerase sigma factor [Candidatus Wolfebacteria bacterium GW2011_GWE2_44_13]
MYEDDGSQDVVVTYTQHPAGGDEDDMGQAVYGKKGWKQEISLNALLMRDIGKFPILERAVQERLLAQYEKTGDERILNKLIETNLRFVVKIAWRYANRYGVPFLDAFSEGSLGLRKGIMKYNPTFGCTLLTYAAHWIEQYIERFIINKRDVVRMTAHAHEVLGKYRTASLRLIHQKKVGSTEEEICKEAGLSSAQRKYLQYRVMPSVSIDTFGLDKDGDDTEMPIPDERPLQDETLGDDDLREKILGTINSFKLRDRWVIVLRFGLNDDPLPTETIAQLMKVTHEEVQILELEALRLLHAPAAVLESAANRGGWIRKKATSELPPQQRFVIQAMYGVVYGEWTLDDIGQALGGLTRERVRQIQNKVLRILKKRIVLNGEGEVEIINPNKGREVE